VKDFKNIQLCLIDVSNFQPTEAPFMHIVWDLDRIEYNGVVIHMSVKGATINGVTYEGVAEFIYLGTLISNNNSVEKEIQRRILAGNRTYFATISLFRIRLLSRAIKILLYKTLIRPVVPYGVEAWTLTKKEETSSSSFQKKNI
jgi:hypothetical protein